MSHNLVVEAHEEKSYELLFCTSVFLVTSDSNSHLAIGLDGRFPMTWIDLEATEYTQANPVNKPELDVPILKAYSTARNTAKQPLNAQQSIPNSHLIFAVLTGRDPGPRCQIS